MANPSDPQRLENFRREQLRQIGFWMAGPVAIVLVLQVIFADRALYPLQWNRYWLFLRLGIIPVGLFAMWLYRRPFGKRFPEFPITMVAFYIAAFHLWMVAQTGYENTRHFHAFIQIILGLALIPFRPVEFFVVILTVLGSFVGLVALNSPIGFGVLGYGDVVWVNTYFLMAILFFYSIHIVRKRSYRLMAQLEDESAGRQATIDRLVASQVKQEQERITSEIAAQVAHDIRSPLMALKVIVSRLHSLPEMERVLADKAVARLADIADLLVPQKLIRRAQSSEVFTTQDSASPTWLVPLLEQLVTEKRVQYQDRAGIQLEFPVDSTNYGAFGMVESEPFLRMLSNIVDNGVEAIEAQGTVKINLSSMRDRIVIKVQDDGRGIAPELLPRLMEKGATFGKASGTGLGLFLAKNAMVSWGGSIRIESTVGKGTQVTLTLRMAPPPPWFLSELDLTRVTSVIVLDDDPTIHDLWKNRIQKNLRLFSDSDTLRETVSADEWAGALFLCDQELRGQRLKGLELIRELGVSDRCVLVTYSYEDEKVVQACLTMRLHLLPKSMAAIIPIK